MRQFKQCGAIAIAVAIFGLCHAASDDYLVVDLSAGAGGPYPISYTNAPPSGGWTDAHKTSRLVLRKLPRGTFTMGSPTNEEGRVADGREDQRSVTLSNDFYLGVFEMTEGQCSRLNTLFGFSAGSKRPAVDVASISFSELVDDAFFRLVNGTSTNFALPNEAQWEYACRAGSALAYCFGSDTNLLSDYAWYNGVSQADAGLKSPNAYGLYDMHGNAAEAVENLAGSGRWLCGGSSSKAASGCRSAVRDNYYFDARVDGFRVCLTVPLKTYTVTVTNGTAEVASGTNGQVVAIWANPPADSDYMFERWLGDTQTVANVFATNTTITIPDRDVAVSATYRYAPRTLTVHDGSGSGHYAPGDEIVIVANAPADGFVFDQWRVDLGPENELGPKFAATNSTTTVTMPTADVILTALYSAIPTYTLTVNGGAGSGSYTNGQSVTISADPPPPHRTFLWAGDTATVSDVTAWETSLVMPAANVAVTATYPPVLYELTVNGGWGGGSYTNGQVVTVTATNRPSSGHVFEVWSGDTNGLADAFAPTTTVTVAGTAELTPLYRPSPMPDNTYLVVDLAASPGQAVTYRDDVPAGGWDDTFKTNRLVLRKLPAGTYLMGSPTSEADRFANETQHTVTLTKVFYMGVFEVTQAQWYRLKGDWPSFSSGTDRPVRPVERVSYVNIRGATNSANWPATAAVDSDSFMGLLRTKTGDAAFDLPTEAQWEYACRAGTTGPYAGTGVLSEMGWYSANSGGGTKTVGQKAANAWGLYDMHGNVSELCLDWSADYSPTNQIDPPGAVGSLLNRRIMRGGAYHVTNALCRSAYRGNLLPTNQWSFAGLRVARTAEAAYRLTVVDGLVNTGGLYFAGTQIPISPARKAGWRTFLRWEVSPAGVSLGSLFDAARADTVVTQPAQPVTLTARYQTRFLLLVK
jgi:formylglycine-generating enzyme required for sulfatase activity